MANNLYWKLVDIIRGRRVDYKNAFGSPAGSRVLLDLAQFCHANESCFDADPRIDAAFEGRREVWLRIQQHLNLNSQQLAQLYHGLSPLEPSERFKNED